MVKIIDCDIFEADVDVICHQVNCQGVMGSGVAKQVRAYYPEVYEAYNLACGQQISLLGATLDVKTFDRKVICNLFAQDKFGTDGEQYTDIEALKRCLENVKRNHLDKRIGIPYLMSCDRGGADWKVVEGLILDILGDCDVTICRYHRD